MRCSAFLKEIQAAWVEVLMEQIEHKVILQ